MYVEWNTGEEEDSQMDGSDVIESDFWWAGVRGECAGIE